MGSEDEPRVKRGDGVGGEMVVAAAAAAAAAAIILEINE